MYAKELASQNPLFCDRQSTDARVPFGTKFMWYEPARGGAGGVVMPIARRSAEEYLGAPRGGTPLLTPCECARVFGRTPHAAQHHRAPRHFRHRPPLDTVRGHRATAGKGLPHRLLIGICASASLCTHAHYGCVLATAG